MTFRAAGAAKMVFCVTNAAAGAAKNHSLQLGSLYVPPPASHSSVFPWQEANQLHAHLMPHAIDTQSSSPAHLKSAEQPSLHMCSQIKNLEVECTYARVLLQKQL